MHEAQKSRYTHIHTIWTWTWSWDLESMRVSICVNKERGREDMGMRIVDHDMTTRGTSMRQI